MPHANHDERRAEILAQTLEWSNEPRFGYFGFCAPLAVGDDSKAPKTIRKPKPEDEGAEPIRNIITNPPKKGATVDTLFSYDPPLCIGDPYIEDAARNRRPKVVMVDPEACFKPPGVVKVSINKLGYEYEPHGTGIRDPKEVYVKYKDATPLRNFVTAPLRKGGGGVLTPGVLFGFGEENRFPEHMPDDYEAGRKLRTKEIEYHKTKMQEMPFKSNNYGNNTFDTVIDAYHYDQPYGIPREEKVSQISVATHEQAFRPSNPSKKGFNATLEPFPEHMPDPVPEPARRKPKDDTEQPPSWRAGAPRECPKPDASVMTNLRNLRSSYPTRFARPVL